MLTATVPWVQKAADIFSETDIKDLKKMGGVRQWFSRKTLA